MQAEQRRKIEDDRFEPQDLLWSAATVHGEDGTELRDLDVEATDNYVVIEEIEDGRIVFEVSAWPHLDKDGRLVFAGEPTEFYQLAETAQQEIDLARLAQDVTGAERALRTGDVFAVRGLPAARESIGQADEIWDVSLVARPSCPGRAVWSGGINGRGGVRHRDGHLRGVRRPPRGNGRRRVRCSPASNADQIRIDADHRRGGTGMSAPVPIPDNRHGAPGGFLASIRPHHLVFFLLNVGDGDQQVLLAPRGAGRPQRASPAPPPGRC